MKKITSILIVIMLLVITGCSNKKVIGIMVFICIINFVVCPSMFNTNLYGLYDRWIGRKPHITGQIRLSIYGKTITLTEENAKLIYMNNNSEKNIVLVDGNFKKDYGNYGENIFRLQLSKSFCRQNINESFKIQIQLQSFRMLVGMIMAKLKRVII